jgi:hypothetical protein
LPEASDFAAGGVEDSVFAAGGSPGELGELGVCANAAVATAALNAVDINQFLEHLSLL